MGRPIEWFQRIPAILEALSRPDAATLLNRRDIEKLFAVSPRTAIHLLSRFGARRFGHTLAISSAELESAVKQLTSQDDYVRLARRHQRVTTKLSESSWNLRLSRITLEESPTRRLADLPSSIHLESGRLRIEFSGAIDLLDQLVQLSKAIGEDFELFEGLLNQDPLSR